MLTVEEERINTLRELNAELRIHCQRLSRISGRMRNAVETGRSSLFALTTGGYQNESGWSFLKVFRQNST